MIRNLLAGAAALALMTGGALAQDSYTTQSTTMTAPTPIAPPADSYKKTTTTRSTDAFGHERQRTDSVSHSQAMTPDGETTTTTRSHAVTGAPTPIVPMERSTSTTTTTDQ